MNIFTIIGILFLIVILICFLPHFGVLFVSLLLFFTVYEKKDFIEWEVVLLITIIFFVIIAFFIFDLKLMLLNIQFLKEIPKIFIPNF